MDAAIAFFVEATGAGNGLARLDDNRTNGLVGATDGALVGALVGAGL